MQIAIAKAVQGELTTTDGLEQLPIIRCEGVQGSHAPAMPVLWLAKSVQDGVQRGVLIDAGQRVQVAFGRLAADLGTAVQVGDATAERAPGQLAVRVAFSGSIRRESRARH